MRKNKIFTSPNEWDDNNDEMFPLKLFLGGTIDNGNSLDWQSSLINELNSYDTVHPIMIYNPRRGKWDMNDDSNEVDKQIEWELHHLERSNLIVMNILGNSKSPISLMEIGLFARSGKLIVFCNPSFYRYENVKIVCKNYGIPLYDTNDILVIKNKILEYANKV